jgi:protein-S-isoprenylcysteine O-methyltransferase Ste14
MRFPSPLPIEITIFVVMLIKGRPWTWIQKEAEWRDSSLRVALGCHCWRMIREPLTFQVTCFWILVRCSGLDSLNRNLFGPKTIKEKGTANSQAFVRVAKTDWLL